MNTATAIQFYSKGKLSDGKVHYSINTYNRVSGLCAYPLDNFSKPKPPTVNGEK